MPTSNTTRTCFTLSQPRKTFFMDSKAERLENFDMVYGINLVNLVNGKVLQLPVRFKRKYCKSE